jgi:hypothetical protein
LDFLMSWKNVGSIQKMNYFLGAPDQDSQWFMISVARHQSGIILT